MKKYLYILFFFPVLSNSSFGQNTRIEFGEPFTFDGASFQLTAELSIVANLEVSKNGNTEFTLTNEDGASGGFVLSFNYLNTQGERKGIPREAGLKLNINLDNDLLKSNSSSIKFPGEFYLETVSLNNDNLAQSNKVTAFFTLNDRSYQVSFILKPATITETTPSTDVIPADRLASCDAKKGCARLECLKKIRADFPNVVDETLDGAIQQLEGRRQYLSRQIGKMSPKKTNTSNRYYLSGNRSDFDVSPRYVVERSDASGWTIVIDRDIDLVIKSKECPSLTREFTLSLEKSPSAVEEVPPEEEEPEVLIIPSPMEDTPNEDEPMVKISTDSFWITKIAPALDTVQNYFLPTALLTENLNQYLIKKDRTPSRSALSYVILWRLWIPTLFLLAIFIWWILPKNKQNKISTDTESDNPIPASMEQKIPVTQEQGQEQQATEEETQEEPVLALEIDIEEIDPGSSGAELGIIPLNELKAHDDYLKIDLTSCWSDTAVTYLYTHRRTILDINKMLHEQYEFPIDLSRLESIPEIGGFLLGNIYEEKDAFQVSIEQFIPITAESQNRYTVKFGDQAWLELDDAFKAFPGLKLVGWFHTHPGHGLFLSDADLREHRQLFTQRYQIAIEIDPLKEGLDIAFFTWTKYGPMNNQEDRMLEKWWSFKRLLNQASS